MKFLIDMNLSPDWIDVLTAEGWEAVHWSTVGTHRATDESIMAWAREQGFVVVTHDLIVIRDKGVRWWIAAQHCVREGRAKSARPLNCTLSASVMEAQLSNHQSIMLDAVHHAMFVGYSARPES